MPLMRKAALFFLSAGLFPAQAVTWHHQQSETVVLSTPADFQLPPGAVWRDGALQVSSRQSVVLTGKLTGLRPFDEVIASWNVEGGSVELEVRPEGSARYFSYGTWSASRRGSVSGQRDASGEMLTDTLRLNRPARALEYRLTLRGGALKLLAFNTSLRARQLSHLGDHGNPALWGNTLAVPQRSQMLYAGGEAWCSPTSTSMILAYYGLARAVPQVARGTQDATYGGAGNWAFNVAYAGAQGLRGVLIRLGSLAEAEPYLRAGMPLGLSLGWRRGELPGAPISFSNGHLMVLVGFDKLGNPIVNDPAASQDRDVRRTYPRAAFEQLWLKHSGGLTYLIAPQLSVP